MKISDCESVRSKIDPVLVEEGREFPSKKLSDMEIVAGKELVEKKGSCEKISIPLRSLKIIAKDERPHY